MRRKIMAAMALAAALVAGRVAAETAVFSGSYMTPYCSTGQSPCQVPAGLIGSRDNIAGIPEPNQPNNLYNSPCMDGTMGQWNNSEALNGFTVTAVNPPYFLGGQSVSLQATVFCDMSFWASDRLNVYVAPSASSPSWVYRGTATCSGSGTRTLSLSFPLLGTNGNIAIRVQFLRGGGISPCIPGDYNDHDDLVLYVPPDSDGDGLVDPLENTMCTSPSDADSDGDGLCDGPRTRVGICVAGEDQDSDGVVDAGETDPCNPDTDGDGMSDGWEDQYASCTGIDPLLAGDSLADLDIDSVANRDEDAAGTSPCSSDTDGDGMDDFWEINNAGCGLNPLANDSAGDPDGDGLANLDEYAAGADPCDPDTDGDGMGDGWEFYYSSCTGIAPAIPGNPAADPDSDLLDNLGEFTVWTDPCNPDTDGDALTDYLEAIAWGTDPLNPDSDGDGLTDGQEINVYGTDPWDPDTDNDGVTDGVEVAGGSNAIDSRITPAYVKRGEIRVSSADSDGYDLAWTGSEFGLIRLEKVSSRDNVLFTRISAGGTDIGPAAFVTNAPYSVQKAGFAWTGSEFGVFYFYFNVVLNFQTFALDGSTSSPPLMISDTFYNSIYPPSLAWSGSEFGLAWQDNRDGNSEVYFARVSAAGDTVIGPQVRLSYDSDSSFEVRMAWTGSEFGVIFRDSRTAAPGLYFARISADGDTIGTEQFIRGDAFGASLQWDGTAYRTAFGCTDGATYNLCFNTMGADGTLLGPDVLLAVGSTSDYFYSTNVETAGPWTGVASYRTNFSTYSYGVFTKVGPAGEVPFPPYYLSSGLNYTSIPSLAWTGSGFGAAWMDNRAIPGAYRYRTYFAFLEDDGDGDGLAPTDEISIYSTDPADWDTDDDLMPDGWEVEHSSCGVNPLAGDSQADPDGDFLPNLAEYNAQTDPCDPDSDNDGISDGNELLVWGTDPLDPDTDGDGISDYDEIFRFLTDPFTPDADSDGDGLPDVVETDTGTFNGYTDTGTDPANPDTDGDGVDDGVEIMNGSDPLSGLVTPGYGMIGDPVRVTYTSAGDAYRPNLVWTGSEYGLAWYDNSSGQYENYFARLVQDGSTVGPSLRLTYLAGGADAPDLVWAGSEFVAAWEQAVPGNILIGTGRIAASGDTVTTRRTIGSNAYGNYAPSLAFNGTDFVVAWEAFISGSNYEMYSARIGAYGDTIGNYHRITTDSANSAKAQLVWGGDYYALTWHDNRSSGQYEIYMAGLYNTGLRATADLRITSDPADSAYPYIAWTGSEYWIAWHDNRGGSYEVYFTRIDDQSLLKISSDVRVSDTPSDSGDLSTVWTGDGLAVAWADFRFGAGEIYFQKISASGSPIGINSRVTWAAGESNWPSLAWTGSEFGLAWQDTRNGPSQIYFARLGADLDGDGLADPLETAAGTDPADWDTDGDGMSDGYEVIQGSACGLNPLAADTTGDPDGDRISNLDEYLRGDDPCVFTDADGDGMPDWWEEQFACLYPASSDGNLDPDQDGLVNLAEWGNSTDPCTFDTDGDGFSDGLEVNSFATDPNSPDADSDADGLPDQVETDTGVFVDTTDTGTDPNDPDTDGDGINDGFESLWGADPFSDRVTPGMIKQDIDLRVTHNVSIQTYPAVAWTGSEYGISWQDARYGYEIFFQRIAADGSTVGSEVRLTNHTGSSIYSSLAWTGSEYGVSWQDNRDGNWEIYFLRLAADGSTAGQETRITSDTADSQRPSMAYGSYRFGLAWYDNRDGNNEIYFASLSIAGTIYYSRRITYDAGDSSYPSLAWNGSVFGMAWYDNRPGNTEIFFNAADWTGDTLGPDVRITHDPSNSYAPSLARLGNDFGIAWYDYQPGYAQIYFVPLMADGTTTAADSLITSDGHSSYIPALAGTGSEYGAAWYENVSSDLEIYFARIGRDGSPLGPAVRLTYSSGNSTVPRLAWSGSEYGVAWTDERDGNQEIYFTRVGIDADGDGLAIAQENAAGTDPAYWDTDDDLMPDGWEADHSSCGINPLTADAAADNDGDGLANLAEYILGTDPCSSDSDGDGMPDDWENAHAACGLDPLAGDSLGDNDADGLSNLQELVHNTDPCNPDTDGEGLSDGDEVNTYGTDPTNPDSDGEGLTDAFEVQTSHTDPLAPDSDGDGLVDADEVMVFGTNPNSTDSDNDGLDDYSEVIIWFTNPWQSDSDGDGLSDWSEIFVSSTNPLNPDTDGDGTPDGEEAGSSLTDRDGDGMPDSWEDLYPCASSTVADDGADPDGDGRSNLYEYLYATSPCSPDTDGDGLCDRFIAVGSTCEGGEAVYGTDASNPDTDGDGLTDGEEVFTYNTDPLNPDSDGDGYSDSIEVNAGTDPTDPNDFPAPPAYLINYQGQLRDAVGTAVSDTVDMVFRIFDAPTGGNMLWQETQTNVLVSQGIYNVLLGSVTPLDPAIFGPAPLYLGLRVNGELMAPRARITSVPYAIKADGLISGRLEMDSRTLTVSLPEEGLTIHVSFNRAFAAPPRVMVSPLDNNIGGEEYVATRVSNVSATGFDVSFRSLYGRGAVGSATFTYQAFGN